MKRRVRLLQFHHDDASVPAAILALWEIEINAAISVLEMERKNIIRVASTSTLGRTRTSDTGFIYTVIIDYETP